MLRDRSILNPAKPEANGFFNRELETGDHEVHALRDFTAGCGLPTED
jgi:hypothetical protein